MLRSVAVVSAAVVVLAGAALLFAADKSAGKAQTACPVTGKPIDAGTSPYVDWEGQRIYFADKGAADTFRKDPEKYFAQFERDGIALANIQTTCPVSGETLEGGDMGEPVTILYKGRTIKFCCGMCPPKFRKDPAKYLAKLPGEQPKPN